MEITKTKIIPPEINFGMSEIKNCNAMTDSPMSLEMLYNGLTIEEWYWNKYDDEIENKPWYYRKYYEDFGVDQHEFYEGPQNPEHLHHLLTDDVLGGSRVRNRCTGDEDLPNTNSKHASMRVKSKTLLDVQLHVPNTRVTSSVTNRNT